MKFIKTCIQIILILAAAYIPLGNTEGAASAQSSVLKWTRMNTPGNIPGINDVARSSEVSRLTIGADGKTFYAIDIPHASNADGGRALYKSVNGGISWTDDLSKRLFQSMSAAEKANFRVWNIAVARESATIIAVVTSSSSSTLPRNLWISLDGGATWKNTSCPAAANISSVDVSADGPFYVAAVGTRTGTGTGSIFTLKIQNVFTWAQQSLSGDVTSLKFSPNYKDDDGLIALYSNNAGTFLAAGLYDLKSNSSTWNLNTGPVEITVKSAGTSAKANQIIGACLELPSDFQSQAASLRRYYVSVDAPVESAGIFRIDDSVVYQLMQATPTKRISSLAYHGTCASGKLLAGEVLGNQCAATVMTWFTDATVTCPGTCWYPASKPATGAAGSESCSGAGYGNAQVAWSPDGTVAYTGTSTTAVLTAGANWPVAYLTGKDLDESAFSISRNNGVTWNQLSLIDTSINRFVDIAPAPDCSGTYLASVNTNQGCSGFDSLWRSSGPIAGPVWERVLCRASSHSACASGQSDDVILGLAGDKPDGSIVFWSPRNSRIMLWSPDHGDSWFTITTRLRVQDFAVEDSSTMFLLEDTGMIQLFKYTKNSWVSASTISSGLTSAYSIATAFTGYTPDNHKGTVLVGTGISGNKDVSYSLDGGNTFIPIAKPLPTGGNTMVIASSSFKSDGYILAINQGGMYAWGAYGGDQEWEVWWGGPSYPSPVTGLAISRNYGFYLGTPASAWSQATPYIRWYAAIADLDPAVSLGVAEQPGRKIKICGGQETGIPVTVLIIDQRDYNPPAGGIWYYEDTLAWNGPLPVSPISKNPVNMDPVSGRAGQIDLLWKPASLAKGYRVQISKDPEFSKIMVDIGKEWGVYYTPQDYDNPGLIIPPGGGLVRDRNDNAWRVPPLEAGHIYYWRVRVRDVLTTDSIQSPWSWTESFIVKAGVPVTLPKFK